MKLKTERLLLLPPGLLLPGAWLGRVRHLPGRLLRQGLDLSRCGLAGG